MFATLKVSQFRTKLAKIHRSLTVWFVSAISMMIGNFSDIVNYVRDNLPFMQQFTSHEIYQAMGIFVFLAGVYVRMKTTKSLDEK